MSRIEGVFDQEEHEKKKYVHHNTQGCVPRHCRGHKSLQMLHSRGQRCGFGFLVTQRLNQFVRAIGSAREKTLIDMSLLETVLFSNKDQTRHLCGAEILVCPFDV